MPCEELSPGVIICRGRERRHRCQDCRKRFAVARCDFPIGKGKGGKVKTCDRWICQFCSDHVKDEDIDYCRSHWRDQ